jgi:methionyl-tRNA formyltransferase
VRVAFAGTPEFARAALAALADAGHEVPLVLTQPDRPAGRGMKLQPSPVKQEALRRGLAVAQPRSLRLDGKYPEDAEAARQAFQAAAPELLVVAAYGLILPEWTLTLPRLGCLNIHGSLLPRWRGAAPIQRAIEAGDALTGITLMQMEAGLDTGPMWRVASTAIEANDTAATLHDRLAGMGARLLVDFLPALAAGGLEATPQPDHGVTYAAKIEKHEAAIAWTTPATDVERRVRAFDPFPGSTFLLGPDVVKLWRARVCESDGEGRGRPGEVLVADGQRLVVACGEQALELLELQRSGGKRLPAAEFLRGLTVRAGTVLAPATA